MIVYKLTCEDASHLGGVMGSEYTIPLFTKLFESVKLAQNYAKEYQIKWPDWAEWKHDSRHYWVDSGKYIWTIEPEIVSK